MTDQDAIRIERLRYLEEAVTQRREAEAYYKRAIAAAHKSGVSNIKIASIAGVSETAIRMYRKRHKL